MSCLAHPIYNALEVEDNRPLFYKPEVQVAEQTVTDQKIHTYAKQLNWYSRITKTRREYHDISW